MNQSGNESPHLKIFPIKELACNLYDGFYFMIKKTMESIDVAKKETEVTWTEKELVLQDHQRI